MQHAAAPRKSFDFMQRALTRRFGVACHYARPFVECGLRFGRGNVRTRK